MISVTWTRLNGSKKRLFCLLLTGAYALLSLLAVCPSLHHLVHSESEDAEHHCVVTDLGDGSLLSQPPLPVTISSPTVSSWRIEAEVAIERPKCEALFPNPERGPPPPLHFA